MEQRKQNIKIIKDINPRAALWDKDGQYGAYKSLSVSFTKDELQKMLSMFDNESDLDKVQVSMLLSANTYNVNANSPHWTTRVKKQTTTENGIPF